ncbi:MAG: protein kinase domain-containing protein [Gemmatirosa sp.]
MSDPMRDRVVAAVGDRFEVGDELGRGGMAVVYRAREVRLRRAIALKVLPPELAFRTGVRERFLREAQTAAQLSHPHIVPIYAADDSGGIAWLAMALVDGETLGQRMTREGRIAPEVASRILAEVADALAYAHSRGVVHRDIKPDNILLDRDSGRSTVTDFGIARAAEEELRLTVTGVAIGSPAYMSPEQAMGEAELDGRSDQYSLAVVGYQLLTGELPFQAASATAMLMKQVAETPRPIAALRPEVPAGLAAAIERALAKKPADRWPDAASFRRALLAPPAPDVVPPAPAAVASAPPAAPPAKPAEDPFTVIVPAVGGGRPSTLASEYQSPAPVTSVREAMASAMRQVDRALNDVGPLVDDALGQARRARQGPPAAPPPPQEAPRQSPEEWRASQKQAEREWKEHLRAQRREWKERHRDQQEQWKEYLKDGNGQQAGLPAPLSRGEVPDNRPLGGMPARMPMGAGLPAPASVPAALPLLSLERRAELFRRKAGSVIMLLVFLTIVNAIHLFLPPWVAFPAWAMIGDLRRRWRPLREEGLVFSELMFEGPQVAVAGAQVRPQSGRRGRPLDQRVRRFRRRAYQGITFFLISFLSLMLGAGLDYEPFVVPFVVAGILALLAGVGVLRNGRYLRRAGVSAKDALARDWEERLGVLDPRPRDEVLAEEAARLAGSQVMASAYGPALRGALDDRLVVRETLAKLAPADRALIPDVQPTINALVDRIAGLVQSLARLEGDVRPGQLEELDDRLARARREPAHSPDRDRKIALLERQRSSIADLAQRRATMLAQLESAQLVLQNMKLDLLKLRASGVGALAEVTTATQEARALSRDIQYAIDAAAEVRAR